MAADELTLLIPAHNGPIDLLVDWDPVPPEVPAHATAFIDQRWTHYVAAARAAGHSLFNGRITQLRSVSCRPAGVGLGVTLHLAPGDYKSFVVTRLRDRAWFAAHAPGCATLALGNSAWITQGDRVLLGRRAAGVSCYAGRLHQFGGVLEELGTPGFPATREGVVAHLWMELQEEIGIIGGQECRGSWPHVLTLVQDEVLGQPELCWHWEMEVDLETLGRGLDEKEHSGAVILKKGAMTSGLWEQLTPVARHAWARWSENPRV